MSPSTFKSLDQLPQSTDIWYCGIRKLRTWVLEEDDAPTRPYLLLIIDLRTGMILHTDLLDHSPDAEEVQEALMTTMRQPKKELELSPHRPWRVDFEDLKLQKDVAPALDQIGVRAKYGPQSENLNALVYDLESQLSGGEPEIPGLLSQRKVTRRMVESLFHAAADFYRAAPWIQLSNNDPLAIQVPPQEEPWYVTVMGQGGMEYGLALYQNFEDLERSYLSLGQPMEAIPPHGSHSLLFNLITEIPFDDLDAIERYGWEIAHQQAHPFPVIFVPPDEVRRPGREEILWYEAALRAIPIFVRKHMDTNPQGELLPVEATIEVSIVTGPVDVDVKYPVGKLPLGVSRPDLTQPDGERAAIRFDRRALEGDLAQITRSMGDRVHDPKLEKAQDLIYQAWEEPDPSRRIALAHKALSMSKDCADAYVLLAEEEAEQVSDALEYYEKGRAAGRRALGETYFVDDVGHFWGLLETRPYMRALEGKASCLWQVNLKDEALKIYQEMLRLNPNDNQGIRYLLVDLYLILNKEKDLQKLIKAYEDDWSAVWHYTKALLAFRKGGASAKANRALAEALEENKYVPDYLMSTKRIPNQLPEYIGLGDDNEAISYAADHLNHWRRTPGALDWLKDQLSSQDVPSTSRNMNKGRKKGRKSRNVPQPGDSVVVNKGVSDPDTGKDLSGWQGWVTAIELDELEKPLLFIHWDSQTLKTMDEAIIEQSVEEGLDWSAMYLWADEVSVTEPRDEQHERDQVIRDMAPRFAWLYLGGQGHRIRSVLEAIEVTDDRTAHKAWARHLLKKLKFPFDAEFQGELVPEFLPWGERVKVTSLEGVDDFNGVLVEVRTESSRQVLPLYDLEVVDEDSSNFQPVDDYNTWFAHR